ncbi:MAG: GNAT superfamily N-acetyltransferase [Zhongshania sp.]|nr:GNAT family N-acetyltransferase [Zhongshania sp.]
MAKLTAPALLRAEHHTSGFCCGNGTLDDWLTKRALKNQNSGASKTFVICESDSTVIGFYALATGSVERSLATSSLSRQMPDPIPVIILGRLAVDEKFKGRNLGASLLKDAILRTLFIADSVGVRGLLVHAISEDAKRFYLKYGFKESPMDAMTLMISVASLKQHL